MIDLTRPEVVIEVCEDCFFQHIYPGENLDSLSQPLDQLWTRENRDEYASGLPFGFGNCPHTADDYDTEHGHDEHSESCETTNFSTRPCEACGSSLAGTRFAMTRIKEDQVRQACESTISTNHSRDLIAVYHGTTTPRFLCGYHATREGVL